MQEPKQEDGSDDDSSGDEEATKSKKKRKLEARLKIADLKQACPRPEVVEVWDVTAQDPKLLVYLKARDRTHHLFPLLGSPFSTSTRDSPCC